MSTNIQSNSKKNKVNTFRKKKPTENTEKIPFDKKKWRQNKYNKQLVVERWEEKRKKAVLRKYYKELKKENITRPQITDFEYDESSELREKKNTTKKLSSFKAAQIEFERIKEEKRRESEEKLRRREDIKAALEKHKKNRIEKLKKLSKKTKKGQPLMKDRAQMLYEKLQSTAGQNS